MEEYKVLDEHANYHYKDIAEMLNSPEYKRYTALIRKGVEEGLLITYPPLPPENTNDR